jgi:peptide/nickel transport system permease protein
MTRWIVLLINLLAVQLLASSLVRLLPGDPAEALMAEASVDLPIEEIRREMGLDQPFWKASLNSLRSTLRGDLGRSLHTREPIFPILQERFLSSIQLALPAAVLALLISFPFGMAAAARRGSFTDRFCSWYGALTASLPTLWIAPLAIWFFCVQLQWFDLDGNSALPILVLGFSASGFWMRLVRERTSEGLALPSAQAARARGLSEMQIQIKYGLRVPLGSILAYFMVQLGHLMTGAFVIEVVFNRAGAGTYFIDAILRRDYPVIEAATWVAASLCLVSNFLGDLIHQWLDPRISAA